MPNFNDQILDRVEEPGTSRFRVNAFRFGCYGLILQGVLLYKTYPRFPDHLYLLEAGAIHWLVFLWISICMGGSFLFLAFWKQEKRGFRLYAAIFLLLLLVVIQVLSLPIFD
ncbi:MAG: hypothetical protein AAF598_21185 [Bacteroidota bacterium]